MMVGLVILRIFRNGHGGSGLRIGLGLLPPAIEQSMLKSVRGNTRINLLYLLDIRGIRVREVDISTNFFEK